MKIEGRPKMMKKGRLIQELEEETAVARMVTTNFQNISDVNNLPYDQNKVMEIHTELKKDELAAARLRLDKIDDNNDPLDQLFPS